MATRPELLIATGPMKGSRYSVGPGGLRLGRSSSNDVQIPDERLSRNHCLVEQFGDGIRITDLASANGTFVNGEQLGADSRPLQVGDTVDVGATTIDIVLEDQGLSGVRTSPAERPPEIEESVDLGLGGADGQPAPSEGAAAKGPESRRSPLANVLWIVAAVVVACAIAVVLYVPRGADAPQAPVVTHNEEDGILSLSYEKVEASSSRIFCYNMTIDGEGTLRVAYDDVPGEDRHVDKKAKLSDFAMKRILEILSTSGFSSLDSEYTGSSVSDENSLRRYRIRVVRWSGVKDILVENSPEPEPFRLVRDALEAFSRNELGIWAIQYSREQLLALSRQSASVADAKWEEREVEYGNLSVAVKAYREAIFYLDTINPKPEWYSILKDKLLRTEAELQVRYDNQRFLADKAMNLADWDSALRELRILCSMVPGKDDPRHAEANARLVDVENRIKKARIGK